MSTRRAVLAAGALALASIVARAQDAPPTPDTSNWVCKFCTFEDGARGWVEPALGWISSGSAHYGDYRGLDDRGLLLDLGGAWRYRDPEKGDGWDVRVDHAPLDARSLAASGGRQGVYRVSLSFDSIPHLVSREATTPFRDDNTLPPGWTTAGSTDQMSDLPAALHPVFLGPRRERSALGVAFIPRPTTDLRLDYRRDEVTGIRATGGAFGTLTSQLPNRLDQTTDRIDVSASHRASVVLLQAGLRSSFFSNHASSLAWQNPYGPLAPGATQGQAAVAPDNQAHQLTLAAALPPGTPLTVSAQLALGRMRQDERFLPATVNPNLATALPRSSLDGRVDTTLASVRAAYAVLPSLRVTADVLHDRRDNRTPTASYTQVVMDTYTGDVRTNVPYGFQRDRWRLGVEQTRGPRLAAGYSDDSKQRSLAGRRDTHERTLWARGSWRPFPEADIRLRYEHAQRDGVGAYAAAPDVPAQNPLVLPYSMAERRRDALRADATVAQAAYSVSVHVGVRHDDYPDTRIGRTQDNVASYGGEIGAQPLESLTLTVFASREQQETDQAGSQAFAQPDWFAERQDTSSMLGVHADWHGPWSLDLGADGVMATSDGVIDLTANSADTAFPVLVTRFYDARLYATYPLRPSLSLRLDLEREVYTARDWALDGVYADTVPNLLAIGQGTRAGNVNAILLSARYRFGG